MGKICFETALVSGYKRVPAPPAKIIAFIKTSIKKLILNLIIAERYLHHQKTLKPKHNIKKNKNNQ